MSMDPKRVVAILELLATQALEEDHQLTNLSAKIRLDAELKVYRDLSFDQCTLEDVFERFVISLANRDRLFNQVFGGITRIQQQIHAYRKVLCFFEPTKVLETYQQRGETLLADLLDARGLAGRSWERQMENPRSGFRLYASGILSGAEYFSRFKDGAAFVAYVTRWRNDPDMIQMLPHYFQALGIPGFGAALAADFLKELGLKELGKPDRWVYRIMEIAGWIQAEATEFAVQRAFWEAWKTLGDVYPPVILDKLMFLVGSGQFIITDPVYRCHSRILDFQRISSS